MRPPHLPRKKDFLPDRRAARPSRWRAQEFRAGLRLCEAETFLRRPFSAQAPPKHRGMPGRAEPTTPRERIGVLIRQWNLMPPSRQKGFRRRFLLARHSRMLEELPAVG